MKTKRHAVYCGDEDDRNGASDGIRVDGVFMVSAQSGVNTGKRGGGNVSEQARKALENLKRVVLAGKCSMKVSKAKCD